MSIIMSSEILRFISELNDLMVIKHQTITNEIKIKKGNIGREQIKTFLNDLVNIVKNEKMKVELSMGITPTKTNASINNISTNILNEDNSSILEVNTGDRAPEDVLNEEVKSNSDLNRLELKFEKRFNKLEKMINNSIDVKTFQQNKNYNNFNRNDQKKCWTCGRFGHISRNCRKNLDKNRYNRPYINSENTLHSQSTQSANLNHFLLNRIPTQNMYSQGQPPLQPFPPYLQNMRVINR